MIGIKFRGIFIDCSQGKLRKHKEAQDLSKKMKHTPFRFNVDYPIAFFQKIGWRPHENIYILDEAERLGRSLPLSFPMNLFMLVFYWPLRKLANETYGYMMFGKAKLE